MPCSLHEPYSGCQPGLFGLLYSHYSSIVASKFTSLGCIRMPPHSYCLCDLLQLGFYVPAIFYRRCNDCVECSWCVPRVRIPVDAVYAILPTCRWHGRSYRQCLIGHQLGVRSTGGRRDPGQYILRAAGQGSGRP